MYISIPYSLLAKYANMPSYLFYAYSLHCFYRDSQDFRRVKEFLNKVSQRLWESHLSDTIEALDELNVEVESDTRGSENSNGQS